MRKVLLFMSLALLAGCAGMMPVATEELTFETVIEAPGQSEDQLFTATKTWIAENFRSAKAVIEYDNREEGTLIGNGVIPMPCTGLGCLGMESWNVPFTMRVDTKPGKFRLTFTNVRATSPATGPSGVAPSQSQFVLIKEKLMGYGPEILAHAEASKSKKDF